MRVSFGQEPLHVQIQKGAGIEKGLVGVPFRQDQRAFLVGSFARGDQSQHSLDAQRGALGGIKGMSGAKEGGGVVLALFNDSVWGIQHVGAADLGDVPGLAAQKGVPLVTRHMKAGGARGGVFPYKIGNGGSHCSSASATCIITAHSMRFLKSSHPYW